MGRIAVAIPNNISPLHLRPAFRSNHVDTCRGAVMDVAITNGNVAAIAVYNSATRGGSNLNALHVFQVDSLSVMSFQNLQVFESAAVV